jgi:hypothetical protein
LALTSEAFFAEALATTFFSVFGASSFVAFATTAFFSSP